MGVAIGLQLSGKKNTRKLRVWIIKLLDLSTVQIYKNTTFRRLALSPKRRVL